MKNFHLTILLFFLSFSLLAQSPLMFKIQALVHDNNNQVLINHDIGVRISILQESDTDLPVYTENLSLKTNNFGLVTVNFGSENPNQFSNIRWSDGVYFTKFETDLSGGTNYSTIGKSQLLAVPFTEYAISSEQSTENDPDFNKWDKSNGISILECQIIDLAHFNKENENDPIYKFSGSYKINENDMTFWNKLTESDPIFVHSVAKTISKNDTSRWNIKSNFDGLFNSLRNIPFFSKLSASGKYADLINKPANIVYGDNSNEKKGLVQFDGVNWVTIDNSKEGQQLAVDASGVIKWKDPVKEVFENNDRPFFEYNSAKDYYDCKPWNYNKPFNSERKYPLIVYLHGAGGAGNINHLNYLGYDTNDGKDDPKAKEFQINHPSFVLVPQTTAGAWDGKKVATLIEDYKKQYRIDSSRIYLIGYSMGGSGSYIVANAYFDSYKQLFAGIIRLAGQSQTEVRNEIAKNTGIWLHIGLDDTSLRINVTRDAYNFLKKYNSTASETSKNISISGYSGTTLTLTKGIREIAKKTEYSNVGHGISSFPFNDNSLIEWLYSQKIE